MGKYRDKGDLLVKIETTIYLINRYSNDNNYSKVRSLIQKDWNRLNEFKNFHLLNSNAKQMFKIIQEEQETGRSNELSQQEKNILNLVNQSIRDMRLPYAKRIFLEHYNLFEKPAAIQWLSSDARFICESWQKAKQ